MLQKPHSGNDTDKFLYRYDISQFQTEYYRIRIDLQEYRIVKETPHGFWIWIGWGLYENYLPDNVYLQDQEYAKIELKRGLKWVSNDCRKRFAYPTIKEAQINFQKRKERQIKILKSQLSHAEDALNEINKQISLNIETKEDFSRIIK